MGAGFSYMRAQGEHFDFALLDIADVRSLPMQGGILAFAKYTPQPSWIGAVENVRLFLTTDDTWPQAKKRYGANLVYFHSMTPEDGRDQLAADMVAFYKPLMNQGG